MEEGQTLGRFASRALAAIDAYLAETRPDMVIVQGDTTTVFCAALAAFYRRIPVGHVEAGLRTWNKYLPYPEEVNRVLTTRLGDLHFAPTEWARQNLLKDGVPGNHIFVTGNTVIDALHYALKKVQQECPEIPGLSYSLMNERLNQPMVLITAHRRESFGAGFASMCKAIATLAQRFPEPSFVYPVHLIRTSVIPYFAYLEKDRTYI